MRPGDPSTARAASSSGRKGFGRHGPWLPHGNREVCLKSVLPQMIVEDYVNKISTLGGRMLAAITTVIAFSPPGLVRAQDQSAQVGGAVTVAPSDPAHMHATKTERHRDGARIDTLHRKLQIASEQEAIWADVASVMRANDERMDALALARHEKAGAVSAMEDLESYRVIAEAHAAGIQAFEVPFQRLYDSMSASQKLNADNVFRSVGHKTTHRKIT